MNMEFPQRKSPRIPGYDYSAPNYYFITICTHEKRCIFGNPGALNTYGNYAEECLLKIQQLHPNLTIDKYVVMPNHVHTIIAVSPSDIENGVPDIPTVIGQYKMAVTKKIHTHDPHKTVWQRSFHDHVIRNQHSYETIWTYIQNNPQKWEEDCFFSTNI